MFMLPTIWWLENFGRQSCGEWKGFWSPSNNQAFLDANQIPFLVVIRKVIKSFQSQIVWWSKPLSIFINYRFLLLVAIFFLSPFITMSSVHQEHSKNILHAHFQNSIIDDLKISIAILWQPKTGSIAIQWWHLLKWWLKVFSHL